MKAKSPKRLFQENRAMLIDLHAHTSRHSSCSVIDPVTLVRRVVEQGLQGLVITEHEYLWDPLEIEGLRKEAGAGSDFLLMAGQEVETDFGHVLVFGPDRSITGYRTLAALRVRYPRAALVWAHPLRSDRRPSPDRLLSPDLDAVEILNSNHSPRGNYLGLELWHRLKFTAVSGSDTHEEATAGILPTLFDHPLKGMEDLVEEIRGGRCRPLCRELSRKGSTIRLDEIVMGIEGGDAPSRRIIVKKPRRTGGWEALEESAKTLMKVRDQGFTGPVFRVPVVLDIDGADDLVIEEDQPGKSLYDLLILADTARGEEYFSLAAQWIARLHKARIRFSSPMATGQQEFENFDAYLRVFKGTGSPWLEEAERLTEAVAGFEEGLWEEEGAGLVLVHGDYHPKNLIIGKDVSALFISVVDFASAMLFHPAFDVGCFIAQFNHQFRDYPRILEHYRPERFIEAYLGEYGEVDLLPFLETVKYFQIRASLSIASFLIHVGKGESTDMRRVMERSLKLLDEVGRAGP